MSWTTPITWTIRDAITMVKLNTHLRDNLNYLFAKPISKASVLGTGADLTTTSTTMVAVDDAQFTLTLDVLTGQDVLLWLSAVCGNPSSTAAVFDIIIDDTNYVSSGNGTPLASGLWYRTGTTNIVIGSLGGMPVVVSGLTAGSHTFKLRWKSLTASTSTLYLNGKYCQFGARIV